MKKDYTSIQNLIDEAFSRFWTGNISDPLSFEKSERLEESLDEYKSRTGKRFRMTKEQKSRGLSRDEAFTEFVNTKKEKE